METFFFMDFGTRFKIGVRQKKRENFAKFFFRRWIMTSAHVPIKFANFYAILFATFWINRPFLGTSFHPNLWLTSFKRNDGRISCAVKKLPEMCRKRCFFRRQVVLCSTYSGFFWLNRLAMLPNRINNRKDLMWWFAKNFGLFFGWILA